MHDDDSNRGPSSATTSRTAPGSHPEASETEFLKQQAADAQAAIAETIHRLQNTLRDSADLAEWTRDYPWASVGIAAAVGFAAAAALTPSGHDPRKEWMETVREALREGYLPSQEPPGAEPKQPSAVSSAVGSLLKTFGGALQTSIAAALAAKVQQQTGEPGTNGHHEPA